MPDTTPLTQTPYALLPDAPNIEAAVPPGFLRLEKYAIPRFTTTSERNSAFSESSPSLGQLCYVSSLGAFGYLVWDGSSWKEFGEYTLLREHIAVKSQAQTRTSSTAGNIDDLVLPVVSGAVYRIEASLVYSTSNGSHVEFNFSFPGPSSTLSMSPLGRSPSVSGSNFADTMNTDARGGRTSGNADARFGGDGTPNDFFGAYVYGILRSEGEGSFQVTFRRVDGSDSPEVACAENSYLILKRIS